MCIRDRYNPESNGLAEAAVKNMKALVERCYARKENLEEAIAAWRNMARADGTSPAELFFGRRQRQKLPMLPITQKSNQDVSARDATHASQTDQRNKNTANFKQLHVGEKVLIQHPATKDWPDTGTIIELREDGLSYIAVSYTHLTLPTIYSV